MSYRSYATEVVAFNVYLLTPTLFPAVSTAKTIPLKRGFAELAEREPWTDKVKQGQKERLYFS
jgi:aspartyl aminopeptidase